MLCQKLLQIKRSRSVENSSPANLYQFLPAMFLPGSWKITSQNIMKGGKQETKNKRTQKIISIEIKYMGVVCDKHLHTINKWNYTVFSLSILQALVIPHFIQLFNSFQTMQIGYRHTEHVRKEVWWWKFIFNKITAFQTVILCCKVLLRVAIVHTSCNQLF